MVKKKTALDIVNEQINSMKPCPFCGCTVGVIFSKGNGYRWYGDHKSPCVLEGNPAASYGLLASLIEEWNTRIKDEKS